jgi:mannan endo-1,4-beta-mannosidase
MKRKVAMMCFVVLLIFCMSAVQAQTGFHITSGKLYDGNNNEFVMVGVSHAHCWYTDKTATAIPDIKKTGANAVRVVLSAGKHGEAWPRNEPSDVQNVINLCKSNRLIAMLECHDTTGYGEKSGAQPLSVAVQYWKDLQSVLTGQEAYVIINIGNEPYGNTSASNWVADTKSAIQSLRSAGFKHTIVVDAPNWGQDWEGIMKTNAQSIVSADSQGNTILSIHMYGVYKNDATINSYINSIRSLGLPLMIGEFGYNHSDGDPDEVSIMYRAADYNISIFGWSWCGNGGGVEYLDMVNAWDANSLTEWGQIWINGANGVKSRSGECSIFGGGSVTPAAPPDPSPTPKLYGSCSGLPVWTGTDIYSATGTKVQYNNMVYSNNWYTTAQNPEEFSDVNEVWTWLGMCSDGSTTEGPTPAPTPAVTPDPTIAPTIAPTPAGGVLGDVNGSGSVDIVDALLVAQYYVGLSPSGFNQSLADTNCSGGIDIVDALRIAQYYVGLITQLC